MSTLAEQIAALKLAPMSEEEHARYLGLPPAQYEKYKGTVTQADLDFNEQARALEILAPLWRSGAEPYPSDVSVNHRRRGKR